MTEAFPNKPACAARRGSVGAGGRVRILAVAVALAIFALAYLSPVQSGTADPAIALLASQALIDHQSLRLDPYVGRADLAYDLTTDYRVRRYDGAYYTQSLGVPVLSVPAVWLANRFGLDMLDQEAELATQNLLSALACTVLFAMLFVLCRHYLAPTASLVVAGVSTLGTSMISTGGTGLWNSDYSSIFVVAALLLIVARRDRRMSVGALVGLGALLVGAFFCRPSSAFLAVAVAVYLLGEHDRRIRIAAGVTLAAVGLAVALPAVVPLPWMAAHYSPARLRFSHPLGEGLYGVLASPSRGLLVFSPFLALVIAGAVLHAGALRRDRVFRLCVVWLVIHTLAVATNEGKWWGGHSFGPRMMIDVLPAFVVLTCLVWRQMAGTAGIRRTAAAAAYLVLGAAAILVHTGQGLFNPATRAWNVTPDVDRDPALALDWRYPQFLASPAMLEARLDDYERRSAQLRRGSLPTYVPGTAIPYDSAAVVFTHWYAPERDWRWTRGDHSDITVRLPDLDADRQYVLQVRAGSLLEQQVRVQVNGVSTATFEVDGFQPTWHVVVVPREVLQSSAENVVRLRVSDPGPTADDPRSLGVALRELRLAALSADRPEIGFRDDPYFGPGFSSAESGWRWTDGASASLFLPVGAVPEEAERVLQVAATGYASQRVGLTVNGVAVAPEMTVGGDIGTIEWHLPAGVLVPNSVNRLEFQLPDAVAPPGDSRRLGLALVSVALARPAR